MNSEAPIEPAPSAPKKTYKPMPVVAIVFCSLGVLFGIGWSYLSISSLIRLAVPYNPHGFNILGDWGSFNQMSSLICGLLAIGHFSACIPLLLFKTRKKQTPRKVWLPVTIIIPVVLSASLIVSCSLCTVSHSKYIDQAYTYKGVTYSYHKTLLADEIVIDGIAPGTECGKTLELPSKIDEMYVRYIGEGAFKDNDIIEEVILPNSVHFINAEAFCCCRSLKKVDLPDQLHNIYENAFRDCPSLKQINEPGTYILYGVYEKQCKISESAFSGSTKDPKWFKEYKNKTADNNN